MNKKVKCYIVLKPALLRVLQVLFSEMEVILNIWDQSRVATNQLKKNLKFMLGWILSLVILFMAHPDSILGVGTKGFGKESPGKIRIAYEIHDFDVSKGEKEKHRKEHQREKLSNGYDEKPATKERDQREKSNKQKYRLNRDNRNFSLGNIVGVTGTVILIGVVAALLFRVKF